MRVFVTGASGWIGSAVVPELLQSGHEVVGLARSDASADALSAAGAVVQRGSIDDLDTLREAASAADAVIHLAFKHEIAFSGDFAGAAAADRRAVETIGDALAGSDRPFTIASGTLLVKPGALATERDGLPGQAQQVPLPAGPGARAATAAYTLGLAERGVRSSVVRLPPTVHGDGDQGFMASIIQTARQSGVSGYRGDGSNRWPGAHVSDAASVFRLAIEKAPAGSALHAVTDEGVPMREIADVIGRHLELPVQPIADADAAEHFTWLADFVAIDGPASSALTREWLGWTPSGPTLLEDLEAGHYFRT